VAGVTSTVRLVLGVAWLHPLTARKPRSRMQGKAVRLAAILSAMSSGKQSPRRLGALADLIVVFCTQARRIGMPHRIHVQRDNRDPVYSNYHGLRLPARGQPRREGELPQRAACLGGSNFHHQPTGSIAERTIRILLACERHGLRRGDERPREKKGSVTLLHGRLLAENVEARTHHLRASG